jgi:ABC-type branched-subunit amino acid transport system substrate-binding protein
MLRPLLATLAAALVAVHAAPAAAQTPGVTPTAVIVGQSAAFTGPAAQLGLQMNAGAKAYFDHVNKQGGVTGRTIELRTRDDKYESSLAAENTRKFIDEDKAFALFGYVGTPTSAAALPIFTEAKVPFIAPYTGAELLRDPFNRQIFHVRASYYDETERIV